MPAIHYFGHGSSLKQGIHDRFLAPYKVVKVHLDVDGLPAGTRRLGAAKRLLISLQAESQRKYYIRGAPVEIVAERVQYMDEDGKLINTLGTPVELINTFGGLPGFEKAVHELQAALYRPAA